MSRGVFAVDRRVWIHPFFKREAFTEREAWLWMIGEASWKARRTRAGDVVVELRRGEFAHSLRFMAERWRWKEPRVRRFLKRLKNDAMIDARTDAGVTVVTICNYDEYQFVPAASDAPSDAPNDTRPTQTRRTEKNGFKKEGAPAGTPRLPRAWKGTERATLSMAGGSRWSRTSMRGGELPTPHSAILLRNCKLLTTTWSTIPRKSKTESRCT